MGGSRTRPQEHRRCHEHPARVARRFERAELTADVAERRKLLTFVVIGAGPTGVEVAGAVAEVARHALSADFRRIDPRSAPIVLIEAGPRILPSLRVAGQSGPPFRYRHAGDLATIGRKAAVVKLDSFHQTGFIGWLFWSIVHVYFLIGARNRFVVAFSWLWNYLTCRSVEEYNPDHTCRAIIIFLISAIALAGFSPFGQTLAQFMMVWQR
jgi:NADH dehydrogenase FAD-containing subunit